MNSRKKLLLNCRAYAVLDKEVLGSASLLKHLVRIKSSGLDIVQLRDKVSCKKEVFQDAKIFQKVFSKSNKLFIINDHVDIALLVDCDGIHLGQDDLPLEAVRKLTGRSKIIGISCHSLRQALKAQEEGADYISIGPIYATPTKPDYKAVGLSLLATCAKKIKIPFFAIGGINPLTISDCIAYGATRAALCRAAYNKSDTLKIVTSLNQF
ncbi:MAG: thiamine phosphate synthase [Candidatus Omnitrophota bacterium]|jgi:thiamine-phosphate pyrophosphorylase